MRNLLASLFLTIIVAAFASIAHAQWQTDGVPLCTAGAYKYYPASVSDGLGGAIVIWVDNRNISWDIYAQRVNAAGVPQWTADGVAIGTGPSVFESYNPPTIAPDGSGGAIVTWSYSFNNGELTIRAQRVDASGVLQWMPDGVFIGVGAWWAYPASPTIVSDNAGGAIITWSDVRSGNYIYAQRLNASGVLQWTPGGVALAPGAGQQLSPGIVADDSGGAIVTWIDNRSATDFDLYAQRVNASGVPQWAADGVALCTAANDQWTPRIVSDGAGGAIVTWDVLGIYDVYAQRVDASGVPQWAADGVALCATAGLQGAPAIVSDGSGGAIVTWYDDRNGASYDIYAQRVDALGFPQWIADGVFVCTAAWEVDHAIAIVSDDLGGAIVAYWDDPGYDIYAQRVSALGALPWTADGVALCTAANVQRHTTIASDGSGGAIAAWIDHRSGNYDIYAQRVLASGDVPTAVAGPMRGPSLIVGEIYPNPFTGTASMDIELGAPSAVQIEVFDVAGRRVRVMTLSDAVSQRVEFDGRSDRGRLLPSGVYFYRITANGTTVTHKMVIAR